MQKQIFIDNLFWLYQYKRECTKFIAIHNENISKSRQEYLRAIDAQSDKVFELSEKTLEEIKKASRSIPLSSLKEYFSIIQQFLDSIYDGMDAEYAIRHNSTGMDLAFPRGVPSIQNFIRSEYDNKFGNSRPKKIAEHFSDLLETPSDLAFCIDALRTKKPKSAINEKGEFQLGERKKAVLGAWVEALREAGYLKTSASYEQISRLLPSVIPKLKINERTLRNKNSVVFKPYYDAIGFRLIKK